MTFQLQQAYLVPKSGFLVPFSDKRFLGEITDFKIRERHPHNSTGPSCTVRKLENAKKKKSKHHLQNNGSVSKEHRNQVKEFAMITMKQFEIQK